MKLTPSKSTEPSFTSVTGFSGFFEGALFGEHLHYSPARFARHGYHGERHGEHHQTVEYHETVGEHGGEVADVYVQPRGIDDHIRAEREHHAHEHVHAELHYGVVEGKYAFGPLEILAQIVRGPRRTSSVRNLRARTT